MIRTILSGVGSLAFAYLVALLVLAVFQRSFIYPAPKGPGRDVPGFERVSYETEDGLELTSGYKAAAPGMPTILYFHGNGADWQSSVVATDQLVPEGYGVLAAEYRGYRGNPGSPDEAGLYADARAAAAYLAGRGVEPERFVVIGNSIGSGPATELAREVEPRALVLISPFTSLPEAAADALWWAPARWLVRDQFNNSAKLEEIDAPILLLHGTADRVIRSYHSRELAAANPRAQLRILNGVGHELAWNSHAEAAVVDFLAGLEEPRSP